jgi:hypothetical protein
MVKSNAAANVIDLEAFRQRKLMREERPASAMNEGRAAAMLVPVWFCWVPVWTPLVP